MGPPAVVMLPRGPVLRHHHVTDDVDVVVYRPHGRLVARAERENPSQYLRAAIRDWDRPVYRS